MPVTVQELTRQSSADANAQATLTREFVVNVLPPEAALVAPGVPVPNEPHPGNPAAFVDNRSATPLGDGVSSRVSVVYSTDRRWRSPYKKPYPNDYAGIPMWEVSFQEVTVTYPFAIRQPREVPSASGPVRKLFWVLQEIDIREQRTIAQLRCTTMGMDAAKIATIHNQINKIHLLPSSNGVDYLFTSPTISQRDTNYWDIRYTWIGDTGSVLPSLALPSGFDPAKIALPPELDANGLIRYAHHSIRPIPSENPETTPPDFIQWCGYSYDNNGWMGLPGITL